MSLVQKKTRLNRLNIWLVTVGVSEASISSPVVEKTVNDPVCLTRSSVRCSECLCASRLTSLTNTQWLSLEARFVSTACRHTDTHRVSNWLQTIERWSAGQDAGFHRVVDSDSTERLWFLQRRPLLSRWCSQITGLCIFFKLLLNDKREKTYNTQNALHCSGPMCSKRLRTSK